MISDVVEAFKMIWKFESTFHFIEFETWILVPSWHSKAFLEVWESLIKLRSTQSSGNMLFELIFGKLEWFQDGIFRWDCEWSCFTLSNMKLEDCLWSLMIVSYNDVSWDAFEPFSAVFEAILSNLFMIFNLLGSIDVKQRFLDFGTFHGFNKSFASWRVFSKVMWYSIHWKHVIWAYIWKVGKLSKWYVLVRIHLFLFYPFQYETRGLFVKFDDCFL